MSEPPPGLDPRVAFAAERTLLAWIRTGIALMGFGFVVARFGFFLRELAVANNYTAPAHLNASTTGVVLVGAGILVNVWASIRHAQILKHLKSGEPFVANARGPVTVGVATGIGGVVLLAILLLAMMR